MGDPITWTMIAAVASQGAITGYQIKSGMDARSDAQEQAKKQEEMQQKAMDDAKKMQEKKDKEQADIIARGEAKEASATSQMLSRALRNNRSSYASSRGGTVLTSPLGLTGSGNSGARKTLLGQ